MTVNHKVVQDCTRVVGFVGQADEQRVLGLAVQAGLVADRPGVELGAVAAAPALNRDRVTVARVVADFVQPLATHGLRRIWLDAADVSAEIASSIAELSTSTGRLRFVEGALCSYYVRCRKAEFAERHGWV